MFTGETFDNISLGKLGEELACEYLVKNGYKILERNHRQKWGEMDIIAKAKDNTLVFVEVKTLKSICPEYLTPEDNLSIIKLHKLQRTCQKFVAQNPDLIDEHKGWQIDLLAISIENPTNSNTAKINHYENI